MRRWQIVDHLKWHKIGIVRTTIDSAGRVVIPKPIRDRLGLSGHAEVEIEEHDGVVEVRPSPNDVRIVETPEGPVAASSPPATALTDDMVRETLEHVRG